jgi:hypothetical protein
VVSYPYLLFLHDDPVLDKELLHLLFVQRQRLFDLPAIASVSLLTTSISCYEGLTV